ncbi:MAG: DUF3108 domain-containing protein [Candidatus Marinimicrobia bacterium]|jgi:hypothetical protein|nr:DUF3108 domain-containing protein [Candidatus Neomarinimicrobiota bacterium]MDP7127480.1 DUF3108 domain-containing protein [Candidatus Neomarinimicrobiota bacterium]MDP7608229.1 DUF3108 domain-containing protein [Candidatus Neomarinimicrobiota bacterium]|tara:strand:- start:4525 stop:5199 length:675 start_codon:yes stop_codon:yes gene_type:complete
MISFVCPRLFAEDYRVYLFGIPIVNVSMEYANDALSFHTETLGMFHYIWPVDNHYFTEYDSISFGVRHYTKSINQRGYSSEMNCIYKSDSSFLSYNGQSVSIVDSIQNIFTLLARVRYQPTEYLDTKWFPMNHEGAPYRARYLWAGTELVDINNVGILCDHYRLDIEETEGVGIKVSDWDYFNDHIASHEALRQIWVEKTGKRRIIQASVSIYGMTVKAEIQDK